MFFGVTINPRLLEDLGDDVLPMTTLECFPANLLPEWEKSQKNCGNWTTTLDGKKVLDEGSEVKTEFSPAGIVPTLGGIF